MSRNLPSGFNQQAGVKRTDGYPGPGPTWTLQPVITGSDKQPPSLDLSIVVGNSGHAIAFPLGDTRAFAAELIALADAWDGSAESELTMAHRNTATEYQWMGSGITHEQKVQIKCLLDRLVRAESRQGALDTVNHETLARPNHQPLLTELPSDDDDYDPAGAIVHRLNATAPIAGSNREAVLAKDARAYVRPAKTGYEIAIDGNLNDLVLGAGATVNEAWLEAALKLNA